MTDLTQTLDPVNAAYLAKWYEIQERIRNDKATEAMMRSNIYKHYFPDPVEGTNTSPAIDSTGAVVKATRKVERKVDEAALDAYKSSSKEDGSNLPKLPWNKLIKYKPELVTSEYRKLTDEERHACDGVLIIKDGSPQVEIVIPKKRGA